MDIHNFTAQSLQSKLCILHPINPLNNHQKGFSTPFALLVTHCQHYTLVIHMYIICNCHPYCLNFVYAILIDK